MQQENERAVFTKEELAEFVHVPVVVEQDLKRIISERLEQCGLYFRLFSRIKTAASMEKKFAWKAYSEEKKLQDLVGVRVNLYFDDDVDICRHIMENTFDLVDWTQSERNEDEFKPIKLNGVFRLPEYLKAEISAKTWDMFIDDTFEIQIKTMFFEGWHEVEHDMRYKGEELWLRYPDFSRYFNSILATLELCDKSMVTLFEDLGHALYKSGQWSDMIRTHFRLKMADAEMYPELEEVLWEDQKLHVDSLGKMIYRTSKRTLVEALGRRSKPIPINVNTIVAVLNEELFHDERLSKIFRERDVYNDGREDSVGESRHYELRPLQRHMVFQMDTEVDGNRIRGVENPDEQCIFRAASEAVFRWVKMRYGDLFPDLPAEPADFDRQIMAYHVRMDYHPESLSMGMHVNHIDMEVGGRVWFSEARLEREEGSRRIRMQVYNGYAEPEGNHPSWDSGGMFFSYPGFYKSIVDTVGIYNGIGCYNRRRILERSQAGQMAEALTNARRTFPIILIVSRDMGDGMMDESWLGTFRVADFIRTVWRYAHVFTAYDRDEAYFLQEWGMAPASEPGGERFYIFWPDGSTDIYNREDIANSSFGRHLEGRPDSRTYAIVRGGQAFYHKVVTNLRTWNITARQ